MAMTCRPVSKDKNDHEGGPVTSDATLVAQTEAEQRAARGAAFLDARMPGWHTWIDLNLLNMDSCFECILGQLFAQAARPGPFVSGYSAGVSQLELDNETINHLGFDWCDDDRPGQMSDLTAAWAAEVRWRR